MNFGEGFKLLVKVVLGGELFWLMLVIKFVFLCKEDKIFIVFDEVDIGVFGCVV